MKKWLEYALIFAVAAFLVRNFFPRTEEVPVEGPPAKPDTVMVHDTITRVDTLVRTEVRRIVETDTVNNVIREFIADTVRIACGTDLPPRHYVTEVLTGEERGDTTWVSGTIWGADSAGLVRQSFTEEIFTLGYLEALQAGPDGVDVAFREFPVCGDSFFENRKDNVEGYVVLRVVEGILSGNLF